MGETLDAKKIRLVKYITAIQDEGFLDLLDSLFERAQTSAQTVSADALQPIRERQTIADMVAEQNYTGFDPKKFKALIEELNIEDKENKLLQQFTP